jgi:hypothetical protein
MSIFNASQRDIITKDALRLESEETVLPGISIQCSDDFDMLSQLRVHYRDPLLQPLELPMHNASIFF